MKKLILITSALLLTTFTYAGEGDAAKSCAMEKKCCCCKACESDKPQGKCCCAEKTKSECKAPEAPAAPATTEGK
ncbi:MAG: hypothetical protein K9M98_00690 [Cephaloticoccus sp.]|nr:hypothetical protein [Cephaloticoccus sp.]MCF7758995.1 hypothetical protein [Cephaloticoccus sp.]